MVIVPVHLNALLSHLQVDYYSKHFEYLRWYFA
jgi:hypothetical protein